MDDSGSKRKQGEAREFWEAAIRLWSESGLSVVSFRQAWKTSRKRQFLSLLGCRLEDGGRCRRDLGYGLAVIPGQPVFWMFSHICFVDVELG